jgi:hypothetical protein
MFSLPKGTGTRTYDYWTRVSRVLQTVKNYQAGGDESPVAACRNAVASIENLPTAGVDPEAVKTCLSVAALFKAKADVSDAITSPAFLMEAFIRGADGDPFGASMDGFYADNAVNERYKIVREQVVRTRALLSSRYGREFPPL